MLEASTNEFGWGPLQVLAGKWIGARERQWMSGQTQQMYEARTFRRRPSLVDSGSGERLFPILFSIRISDFYERQRQVSEEMGYLIWRPEARLVTQVTTDPNGSVTIEEASIEQADETVWMAFNPARQVLHQSIKNHPENDTQRYETTIIFDSSTFRFDLASSGHSNEPGRSSFRDVGELMRIGS